MVRLSRCLYLGNDPTLLAAFMTAAREACRELRCMVEAINADRAARPFLIASKNGRPTWSGVNRSSVVSASTWSGPGYTVKLGRFRQAHAGTLTQLIDIFGRERLDRTRQLTSIGIGRCVGVCRDPRRHRPEDGQQDSSTHGSPFEGLPRAAVHGRGD